MWPSVSQSVREVGWVPPRSPTRAAHQHQHQHQHPWARYLALGNCARAATHCYCYGYGYGYYAPSFSVQPVQRSPGDS